DLVLNKVDLVSDEAIFGRFEKEVGGDSEIFRISAATRQNLDELLYRVADLIEETDTAEDITENTDEREVYRHEKDRDAFEITRKDDGAYVIYGASIERIYISTDFNRDAAVRRFARQMRTMGIDDALRDRGIKAGDTVRILGGEFEFVE